MMKTKDLFHNRRKYYVLARHHALANGMFEYAGFDVIERATDQAIKRFYTFEEANKYAQSLEGGRAFDGWTPSFMLKNIFGVSEKSR